jgi:hypothetical protein
MNEEQNNVIRQLVKEKRYDEARALLMKIRSDPQAQQWLNALEHMHQRDGKFRPFRFDANRLVVWTILGIGILFFLIFAMPAIIQALSGQ